MSSRAATREYIHFLVKYDDSILYTCSRIKIQTDGRVRIGSRYPVIYGNSTDQPEMSTVVDTGDYLQMKKKQNLVSLTLHLRLTRLSIHRYILQRSHYCNHMYRLRHSNCIKEKETLQ
jgi:hypothetical protein